MTPQQQEKLYVATKERYKNWSTRQVSGYVHGVVDGSKHDEQQQKFIDRNDYCIGYIYGFYDAQGDNVIVKILDRPNRRSEPKWWK